MISKELKRIVQEYEQQEQEQNASGSSAMQKHKLKHLWIKKATGLGITEFMLRFMCFLALRNDDYHGSQMVIITGPNQELAIKCIKRMNHSLNPMG
jgi:hypothetical protein